MTAFSSEKLKGERDHSWGSRKQSIQCMDANASACEGSRSQLSHAQEFKSKSCMVAPEYLIENVEICGKFSKISPNIEFLPEIYQSRFRFFQTYENTQISVVNLGCEFPQIFANLQNFEILTPSIDFC